MVVENVEIDSREKNLSCWQNIWNSRQITADIKEKLGNQEVICGGGISLIYLPFLIKQMETMLRSYQQSVTLSQDGTEKVLSISLKL